MQKDKEIERSEMTIAQLFVLTVLPSAAATVLYIAVGFFRQGIPAIGLFLIVTLFTLFPFEIMSVLSANKKEYGTYGFKAAFLNHERMEWRKVFFYGFVLFGFAGIMSITVQPLENWLVSGASGKLSSFLPPYFNWDNMELMKSYPRGILLFTGILYLVLNGFVFPIIEEIYFRGYLTQKLGRYGLFSPIIVTLAFSLYHWWLPFNNLFRMCVFIVAALTVYKKRNIYISMIFHCLCNLFSSVNFVIALLGI